MSQSLRTFLIVLFFAATLGEVRAEQPNIILIFIEQCDLTEDIGETTNLADEKTGRVADLKRTLNAWRQDVIARMPIPNPNYDEARAGQWWSMRTVKPVDLESRNRFPPTEKDL